MDAQQFSRRMVEILPYMLREFARRERNDLTRGVISFPQMIALETASRKERVKMSELAQLLSIKMSTATVLADRLVKQGMIQRSRDEKDRRLVWIRITAKGRRVIERFLTEKQKSMEHIFGGLSSEDREQYLRIMTKVRAHLLKP